MKRIYCKCGCKEKVTPGKTYIHGHNRPWLGYKLTEEHKDKIRKTLTGVVRPIEVREKISKSVSGINNPFYGQTHTNKVKQNHSKRMSGENHPFYGLRGKDHHNYGRVISIEEREKHSIAQRGAKGSNWQGGKSFEPYGIEFNRELKAVIRKRDNNCCRLCGKRKYKRERDVHHIDYNKQNNDINNLITLCVLCHTKTNYDRKRYRLLFQKMIVKSIGVKYDSKK